MNCLRFDICLDSTVDHVINLVHFLREQTVVFIYFTTNPLSLSLSSLNKIQNVRVAYRWLANSLKYMRSIPFNRDDFR